MALLDFISIGASFAQGELAAQSAQVRAQALTAQSRYRSQVLRRQAELHRHNAKIARINQHRLSVSHTEQVRETGRVAGQVLSEKEIERSASGFAYNSASYEYQRRADRERINDNLERLGRIYAAGSESFANQAYSAELAAYESERGAEFELAQIPYHQYGAEMGGFGARIGAISQITSILGSASRRGATGA